MSGNILFRPGRDVIVHNLFPYLDDRDWVHFNVLNRQTRSLVAQDALGARIRSAFAAERNVVFYFIPKTYHDCNLSYRMQRAYDESLAQGPQLYQYLVGGMISSSFIKLLYDGKISRLDTLAQGFSHIGRLGYMLGNIFTMGSLLYPVENQDMVVFGGVSLSYGLVIISKDLIAGAYWTANGALLLQRGFSSYEKATTLTGRIVGYAKANAIRLQDRVQRAASKIKCIFKPRLEQLMYKLSPFSHSTENPDYH